MMHHRWLLIMLLGILGLHSAVADTGFRKYAGEFMTIDVSARGQALGGAFTALANDVYATFYNPAGLSQLTATQIGFTHTQQFIASVNYDYIGFARPISDNKAIGFSLIRLGVDNIKDSRTAGILGIDGELLNIDFSQVEKFNSADYVFFLSMSNRLNEQLAWGFNIKLVRRDLANHSANGLGFDAGFLYTLSNRWKFSGMFRNITTTLVAWDTGEKELVSPTLRFGTSYLIPLPGLNGHLIPNIDLIMQTQRSTNLASGFGSDMLSGAVGGELLINEVVALRGGYDELQRLNLGVGIRIPHINVDYAFTSFDDELGNAHRIGLMVDFQK